MNLKVDINMKNFPDDLFDINDKQINNDDVITDQEDYYRIWFDEVNEEVVAFSPTAGYLDSKYLDPAVIKHFFERIGTFEECEHIILPDDSL